MLFAFISLSLKFYYCVIIKQMNNNKYYITVSFFFSKRRKNSSLCAHRVAAYITVSFIPCNTYTYSYVITITVYPTYPNYNQIKSTPPVVKKKKKNHLQARARVNRIRISRTLIKVNVFSN